LYRDTNHIYIRLQEAGHHVYFTKTDATKLTTIQSHKGYARKYHSELCTEYILITNFCALIIIYS